MRGHRQMLETTNGGNCFSECGCGWSGGVYRSRTLAREAHKAHTEGRDTSVGKVGTTFLIGPRARGMTA